MNDDNKTCEDCKYYLNDYWNCQGQNKPCHEFVESEELQK
jgi:hypothetical protein